MWLSTLWHRWYGRSRPLPSSLLRRHSARQRPGVHPRLEALEDRTLLTNYIAANVSDLIADINVSNITGGSNQISLSAPTNSPYGLTGSLLDPGTLSIAKNDHLTILGNGDTIERSTSSGAFGLFYVAKGASLTLDDLTLSNGEADNVLFGQLAGGAIYNLGALTLNDTTLINNTALEGGAIYSAGIKLNLTKVTVQNNSAVGLNGSGGKNGANITSSLQHGSAGGDGGNGSAAYGGGLYVASGTVTLRGVTFSGNSAQGGQGGQGGQAGNITGINRNGAAGGGGGNGGAAYGGGLYVAGGSVKLANDVLSDNRAQGGAGGTGGAGGAGGTQINSGTQINRGGTPHGGAGGSGGMGEAAFGGGLYVDGGTVTLARDILGSNIAQGGRGGNGGTGGAGGVYVSTLGGSVGNSAVGRTGGGGAGGSGGGAFGGGLYVNSGSVSLSDATLCSSTSQGGSGGSGGQDYLTISGQGVNGSHGSADGGGIYSASGGITLTNATLSGNAALGGEASGGNLYDFGAKLTLLNDTLAYGNARGGAASGGGLQLEGLAVVQMANTLIADNTAPSDPDISGTVSSSDHDLIGNSTGFQADSSNHDILNPADFTLGPLANNGGPLVGAPGTTQVLQTVDPLPTNSTPNPALDAGDNNAPNLPATDERGYSRIFNNTVDIGAIEYRYDLAVSVSAPSSVQGGQFFSYTITISNKGPDTAGAVLTDVLPGGAVFQSITGLSSGTASNQNGTVTATIALAAGASTTFALNVVNKDNTATNLRNQIAVGPTSWDTNPSNNSVTVDTTVVPLNLSSTLATPDDLVDAINLDTYDFANRPTTLDLAAGTTFDFAAAHNSPTSADALPVITGAITLVGNGDTIERTGSKVFRLFDVASGGSLTLNDLTLSGGLAFGGAKASEGGAIYSSGKLTLRDVTVKSNEAEGSSGPVMQGRNASGGGLYVEGGAVTLSKVTFSQNIAQGGNGGVTASGQGSHEGGDASGGGLYVGGGVVTLNKVTFSQNVAQAGNGGTPEAAGDGADGADAWGGGFYLGGGAATIDNTTFSQNRAQGGAGGDGGRFVNVIFGTNRRNGPDYGYGGKGGYGYGGGLYVTGASVTVTLTNSVLNGNNEAIGGNGGNAGNNYTDAFGGDGGWGFGGGLDLAGASVVCSQDTLSANVALGGAGGHAADLANTNGGQGHTGDNSGIGGIGGFGLGGGVYLSTGTLTLTNNTLQGNNAQGGTGGGNQLAQVGVGGFGRGGGLYVGRGAATLTNDTLSGNIAQAGLGGLVGHGTFRGRGGVDEGGGVYISANSTHTSLTNTIIALNQASSAATSSLGQDVYGNVSSSDHDLIGDGSNSNLSQGDSGSDLVGYTAQQLMLGPLANNGGPTQTMALLSGSPAIDAGDNSAAPGATDQRGYARIAGFAIDIGAYEYGATPAASNLFVSGQAAYGTAPGGEIVYNLTVKNLSSTAQSNVTLADVLPADTTLVSWLPATGTWSQSAWDHDAPAAGNSGTVTAWLASLPGKAAADFTLIVKVNSSTPLGTIVTDTASVGPVIGDSNPGNNSKTFRTTVTAGTTISTGIQVSSGKISYDSTSGLWVEKVKITNTSNLFGWIGSLALELTGLRSIVTLANADGVAPNGDPYIDFVPPGGSLAPGQSITLTLEFEAPSATSIKGYGTQVVQGW